MATRLGGLQPQVPVITVAGTNGKGSTVSLLASMLSAAGHRVGCYTSPHLCQYNERIQIGANTVSDALLCEAFEAVEAVRGELRLTYFEFGTLAALWLFRQARLDIWLLEVGLGGRLDATNVIDADIGLITSISLDHTEWLGSDRDQIGREKAGICRTGRAAVIADPDPPQGLLHQLDTIGAIPYRYGSSFTANTEETGWTWSDHNCSVHHLPYLKQPGRAQLRNAAAAIMALKCLPMPLRPNTAAIREGLARADVPGRFQRIAGSVEWILDVAHNVEAAHTLSENLAATPRRGQTIVVLGLQADKDSAGFVHTLDPHVDQWLLTSLPVGRHPRSANDLLVQCRHATTAPIRCYDAWQEALQIAKVEANPGDRIVVTGSFHLVGAALTTSPWHQRTTHRLDVVPGALTSVLVERTNNAPLRKPAS